MTKQTYGSTSWKANDDDSRSTRSGRSATSSIGSRRPFYFRRHKKKQQDHEETSISDATDLLLDHRSSPHFANDKENVKEEHDQLLDLDAIIGMCVLKLQLPPSSKNVPEDATPNGLGRSTAGIKEGRGVGRATKRLKGSASAVRNQATRLVPKGNDNASLDNETPKRRSTCLTALCRALNSFGDLVTYPIRIFLWKYAWFQVSLVPVVLLIGWIFTGLFLSHFWIIEDLLLPYIALGLSALAIVLQSWIVSRPLAAGIVSLVSQLQGVIDAAFGEMMEVVPRKIAHVLKRLCVPPAAADNLCRALFAPVRQVLGTVYKILPNVDSIVPADRIQAQPVAVLVFFCLLVGLVLGQVMLILMMGSNINGSVEICLALTICILLGSVALEAHRIMVYVLALIESVVNLAIQFLLRKLLPVAKLQKSLDYVERLVPNKNKRGRRKQAAKQQKPIKESAPVDVISTAV